MLLGSDIMPQFKNIKHYFNVDMHNSRHRTIIPKATLDEITIAVYGISAMAWFKSIQKQGNMFIKHELVKLAKLSNERSIIDGPRLPIRQRKDQSKSPDPADYKSDGVSGYLPRTDHQHSGNSEQFDNYSRLLCRLNYNKDADKSY